MVGAAVLIATQAAIVLAAVAWYLRGEKKKD